MIWTSHLSPDVARHVSRLLRVSVVDQGMLGFGRSDDDVSIAKYVRQLAIKLQPDEAWLFYGQEHGCPVFMLFIERFPHPTSRHLAEVSKAIIDPKWRGRGIVKRVLRELITKAREVGIGAFVLDVREGTRAAQLWQLLGFRVYGRLDDYARYDNHSYSGLYMAATITDLDQRSRITRTTAPVSSVY